jgi:SulP family sulfate permease
MMRVIHSSLAAIGNRLGSARPEHQHLRADIVARLPSTIGSVPDGMAAAVLVAVNPDQGLYAGFAGPIAGGLSSSTRLMVITTTSAASLVAGSAPKSVASNSDAHVTRKGGSGYG